MALINCPECRKEVSDSAKKCPNCGYNLRKKNNRVLPIILIISGSVFMLFLILIILIVGITRIGVKEKTESISEHLPVVTENSATSDNSQWELSKIYVNQSDRDYVSDVNVVGGGTFYCHFKMDDGPKGGEEIKLRFVVRMAGEEMEEYLSARVGAWKTYNVGPVYGPEGSTEELKIRIYNAETDELMGEKVIKVNF